MLANHIFSEWFLRRKQDCTKRLQNTLKIVSPFKASSKEVNDKLMYMNSVVLKAIFLKGNYIVLLLCIISSCKGQSVYHLFGLFVETCSIKKENWPHFREPHASVMFLSNSVSHAGLALALPNKSSPALLIKILCMISQQSYVNQNILSQRCYSF